MRGAVYVIAVCVGCALLFCLYFAVGLWAILVAIAPLSHGGVEMLSEWLTFWYAANGVVLVASAVAVWDVLKRGEFLQTSLRLMVFFSLMLVAGYCLNLFRVSE